MTKVSTYLNFPGTTEAAFNFYKAVFGGDFQGDEFAGGIMRFKDMPAGAEHPPIPEAEKNLVMHVALPILGGHVIMGTDASESMGFKLKFGNNMYINLEPDTREETDRLFNALSAGGQVEMALQDMFWGAYYGSCVDKFGTRWMFNCSVK